MPGRRRPLLVGLRVLDAELRGCPSSLDTCTKYMFTIHRPCTSHGGLSQ